MFIKTKYLFYIIFVIIIFLTVDICILLGVCNELEHRIRDKRD